MKFYFDVKFYLLLWYGCISTEEVLRKVLLGYEGFTSEVKKFDFDMKF